MIDTMQLFKVPGHPGASLRLATATTSLLMLAACASMPQPPTAELQAAELAIADAERARVADYASAELSEARDKLRAAHSAVQQEKMVLGPSASPNSRALTPSWLQPGPKRPGPGW